eukprot:m.15712 g.15712  ORF g.15712 m.15712 type:complete len:505 (+) comp5076_c1_seq1:182-1696(+)
MAPAPLLVRLKLSGDTKVTTVSVPCSPPRPRSVVAKKQQAAKKHQHQHEQDDQEEKYDHHQQHVLDASGALPKACTTSPRAVLAMARACKQCPLVSLQELREASAHKMARRACPLRTLLLIQNALAVLDTNPTFCTQLSDATEAARQRCDNDGVAETLGRRSGLMSVGDDDEHDADGNVTVADVCMGEHEGYYEHDDGDANVEDGDGDGECSSEDKENTRRTTRRRIARAYSPSLRRAKAREAADFACPPCDDNSDSNDSNDEDGMIDVVGGGCHHRQADTLFARRAMSSAATVNTMAAEDVVDLDFDDEQGAAQRSQLGGLATALGLNHTDTASSVTNGGGGGGGVGGVGGSNNNNPAPKRKRYDGNVDCQDDMGPGQDALDNLLYDPTLCGSSRALAGPGHGDDDDESVGNVFVDEVEKIRGTCSPAVLAAAGAMDTASDDEHDEGGVIVGTGTTPALAHQQQEEQPPRHGPAAGKRSRPAPSCSLGGLRNADVCIRQLPVC